MILYAIIIIIVSMQLEFFICLSRWTTDGKHDMAMYLHDSILVGGICIVQGSSVGIHALYTGQTIAVLAFLSKQDPVPPAGCHYNCTSMPYSDLH